MTTAVAAFSPRHALARMESGATRERWARFRVTTVWSLLILNVLTFYSVTWDSKPLYLPIPSVLGKLIAQGALPLALLVALTVNRRLLIRPNVFLCLITLLVIEAVLTMLRHQYVAETLFGTVFRTSRLAGFTATLWLLTPWWGRRDLLLVRCHLTAMAVILGPIPPTQVAHYAAVTLGLVALLWLSGRISGKVTLAVVVATGAILLMTHTRTALFAMVVGLVVGSLSLFAAKSRVRKAFLTVGLVLAVGAVTLASVVTNWLARGQSSQQLTALTGRTTVWQLVLTFPRNWFEVVFGFGLSNNSFNGLPIDSNWLATYNDQGLVGIGLCAAFLLFIFISAYFQPRGAPRAMALFLATYVLIASYTETGLSQPSDYLLEMALAASLLVPPLTGQRRRPRALPRLLDDEAPVWRPRLAQKGLS